MLCVCVVCVFIGKKESKMHNILTRVYLFNNVTISYAIIIYAHFIINPSPINPLEPE